MNYRALSRSLLCLLLWIITSRLNAQDSVDATTLYGKYMCGYQGWFRANGDGANKGWVHWFSSTTDPSVSKVRVDQFPDLRELDADELFNTNLRYSDGSVVKLFSSHIEKTVVRHFKWMKENDIDGVWVQRFTTPHIGLTEPTNRVLMNCRKGAETYGRVFVVMYDISNNKAATLVDDIKNDWMHLVDVIKITESPRYLRHKGKPLVSIWGFGCDGRPGTPEQAAALISWFQKDAPAKYQATFMGGVNGSTGSSHWSEQPEPWASVFRSMDVISPWTVGRYSDTTSADGWKVSRIIPDMAVAAAAGKDYLPVIWPGFSWHNMKGAAENQIPRRGGTFLWRQAYNAIEAGANMLYGAMFDEVDEGTAIYKACPKRSMAPVDPYWLTLDADGYDLPSDWYLRLSGLAKKMLNRQIPLSKTMPLVPRPIQGGTRYRLQTFKLGEGQVRTEGSETVLMSPSDTSYFVGTWVVLAAEPALGWKFDGWSGDLTGTSNPDSVLMDANKSITATFSQIPAGQFEVRRTIVGSGVVVAEPPGPYYSSGTVVTLRARPAWDSTLDGWSGDVSGTDTVVTITMNGHKSVTATFRPLKTCGLNVRSALHGSIVLQPSGGSYPEGTQVLLRAQPETGWEFHEWTGDVNGTTNPQNVTLNENKEVKAVFRKIGGGVRSSGAIHDSYVQGAFSASRNFNADSALRVREGSSDLTRYRAYVQFDVSSVTGNVLGAVLKMRVRPIGLPDGKGIKAGVYAVSTDTWTETALNWSTAPVAGALLDSVTVSTVGMEYSWDVGTYVAREIAGDKKVSVMVKEYAAMDKRIDFERREDGKGPLLTIMTDTPTGVEKDEMVPTHYALHQNYPNPFNPETSIGFDLPTEGWISLKVYDVLGKEVATLVEQQMQHGMHRVQWNASAIPSGVYVCQLKAGTFASTIKVLLMK
jgi:uncharacterized repeat protein (TIGR02543 family)